MRNQENHNKHLYRMTLPLAIFAICTVFLISTNMVLASSLNLGMVDSKPSKIIKRFTPLMKYLESKGLPKGKVHVAKTKDQMAEYFKSGKVDFMFESPYLAVKLMDDAGVRPVIIREKSGVKKYNSVIFVKKDSPVKELKDLVGKVVAFEDPGSTSSFMLPKNLLETNGLKIQESKKPIPGVVAYYFSKDDDNTIYQVKAGKMADAGGIKKSKVEGSADFRILTPESSFVPRHVMLVRKDYPVDKLVEILLGMVNDSSAKPVLKTIKTPTGFSKFEGDPKITMDTTVRKALGL